MNQNLRDRYKSILIGEINVCLFDIYVMDSKKMECVHPVFHMFKRFCKISCEKFIKNIETIFFSCFHIFVENGTQSFLLKMVKITFFFFFIISSFL